MPSISLLTLDESTLYHYNQWHGNDGTNSITDYINNWMDDVRQSVTPAPASKPSSSSTRLERLRDQSLASRSTRSSAASIKNATTGLVIRMGGISDCDEINGPERDFAIKSSFKGKKRLTSEGIVRIKDVNPDELTEVTRKRKKRRVVEVGEPTSKPKCRASNTDLPDGVLEGHRFQRRFIPTAVWYHAAQIDAWNTNDEDLVPALQAIWHAVYGRTVPHQIEVNDLVFRVTRQRISDTWNSLIGSSAIDVVNSFLNRVDLFKAEKRRREFAKNALDTFQFLYRDTTSSNRKEWKGPFEGPFVIQTFAAHFSAISGSRTVGVLGEPSEVWNLPYSALALAAAAVERALTLWANGAITNETGRTSKSGTIIKSSLNKASGKVSTSTLSFNETNWGSATRAYAKSARRLKPKRFMRIMEMAISFLETNSTTPQQDVNTDFDSNDIRANLVNLCDDDDESSRGSGTE